MFYDDDLGTENIFFPVCLISEYASFTINVYLYSIHLGIWNVTAVFQFPFNKMSSLCNGNDDFTSLHCRMYLGRVQYLHYNNYFLYYGYDQKYCSGIHTTTSF